MRRAPGFYSKAEIHPDGTYPPTMDDLAPFCSVHDEACAGVRVHIDGRIEAVQTVALTMPSCVVAPEPESVVEAPQTNAEPPAKAVSASFVAENEALAPVAPATSMTIATEQEVANMNASDVFLTCKERGLPCTGSVKKMRVGLIKALLAERGAQ